MLPYQERVVTEKNVLDIKIYDLNNFIKQSASFTHIPPEEKERLIEQLSVMRRYSNILMSRIANFK